MALRDLFVKFGIDVEGKEKLDAADKSIKSAIGSAREFGRALRFAAGAFTGGFIGRAISGFINDQIAMADRLKHSAEALGLSTDELQKYSYAADLMQVPVQQTAIALRFFNRAVGEAALGGKGASKVFSQVGINIRDANGQIRPSNELLFEFADKLKGTHSQALRTAYAMRLLGRNGAALLPVLQTGSEALKQAFKDVDELGGGFNEKFIENAHETYNQMRRLKMGWRSISVAIVTELLPVVNRWIEGSIKTAKWLIAMAKHTYGFRTALMALAAGALIIALTKLFALFAPASLDLKSLLGMFLKYPLIAVFTAAITALYLAFDSFYTFLEGGDSVLGRFLDMIGGYGNAAVVRNQLKEIFDEIYAAWQQIKSPLGEMGQIIGHVFADSVPSIIKWGGIFATYVLDKLDTAITYARILAGTSLIKDIFKGTPVSEEDKATIREAMGGLRGRQALYGKAALDFDDIGKPPPFLGVPYKEGVDPRRVNQANMGSNLDPNSQAPFAPVTIEIKQTIHASSDPKATGDAVARGTKGAVKDALAEHRDTYNAVTAGSPVTGN